MFNAVVVMVMLSAAEPVLADQSIAAPSNAARFGSSRQAQSDPYGKLFAPRKAVAPTGVESQRAAKRRVVCGLTIIAADSAIDPSILVEPNVDVIDYKIRALDPPLCNPRR
jgi:hypothetical protein